ncbi:hypothetical protein, partial [Streptomyces monomycini]|uniref:hypothetical protein n=1 Tax=Streptomyces monomycini TaxID=371720 RepID=UPI001AD83AE5
MLATAAAENFARPPRLSPDHRFFGVQQCRPERETHPFHHFPAPSDAKGPGTLGWRAGAFRSIHCYPFDAVRQSLTQVLPNAGFS